MQKIQPLGKETEEADVFESNLSYTHDCWESKMTL